MSGPIVPPLEVTEVDGNPSGRPITKIIVSNGDLTISGRTATIDTSGSGGIPGTPAKSVQFNSDPAGTFTGDAGFIVSTAGGGATTIAGIGNLLVGADKVGMNAVNGTISLMSEGTGEILLRSSSDAGGTFTDSIVNIMSNANTDDAQLKFRDSANTDNGSITLDGSGHIILNNNVAAKDIDLKVLTTGQVEVANQTTDTDTVLSIMGNGTGAPRIDMQNASKRVWIECQTNKKLTVQGGAAGNTFVFDVSSATGGIQFPDGTSLVSAEGTAILSTGETGATKFLREDGDGTCSWQAAGGGGGGNEFNAEFPTVWGSYRYIVSQGPPWGNLDAAGGSQTVSTFSKPFAFPFLSPVSGDVSEVGIYLKTSDLANLQIAIYSDDDGLPDSRMCYASIDMSSGNGALYQTSITDTATLVRGTQYWFSMNSDADPGSSALYGSRYEYIPGMGIGNDVNGTPSTIKDNAGSDYGLPAATFTSSYAYNSVDRPAFSIKVS